MGVDSVSSQLQSSSYERSVGNSCLYSYASTHFLYVGFLIVNCNKHSVNYTVTELGARKRRKHIWTMSLVSANNVRGRGSERRNSGDHCPTNILQTMIPCSREMLRCHRCDFSYLHKTDDVKKYTINGNILISYYLIRLVLFTYIFIWLFLF